MFLSQIFCLFLADIYSSLFLLSTVTLILSRQCVNIIFEHKELQLHNVSTATTAALDFAFYVPHIPPLHAESLFNQLVVTLMSTLRINFSDQCA